MAITHTRTFTRPTIRTPFWVANDLVKNYIKTTYIDSGKILDLQRVEDATGLLIVSLITVFANTESRDEFIADPRMVDLYSQRTLHNQYHNIIEELTIEND